ncbi:MAG: hypothetical protein HC819_05050 [Cyclobacteriaceae bacterium]|nr:hypothetical protein [Cyclobacteriaceae bacterium]
MSDVAKPEYSDRKLAAIMFTDIVGYTAMMQRDEGNALAIIERHRFVIEKYTQIFNGKILHYYGDGSLAIFPSAFEAVECALDIQKELVNEPKVPLRIGIHLGDVKIKDGAVFGDGVNMAARIESIGTAGSVLITDMIYHLVRNHVGIKTVPLGDFKLKNVDYPVPVYALKSDFLVVPKTRELQGRIKSDQRKYTWYALFIAIVVLMLAAYFINKNFLASNSLKDPEDKSIAVLPFNNLSNDPQQDYFSNGIIEDVINHLVKIADLKVKSRTTTEQYKNHNKTVPEIGRELDVSYILEGSIRKAGNKVRIVAQLIDVKNDIHIWSETFDREITEIFEIQSDVAIEIAKVLEARLTADERRHIRGGPDKRGRPANITAYDFVLRARGIWRSWNDEEDLRRALHLTDQAIAIDSSFARAFVLKGTILHYGLRHYGVPTRVWINEALDLADKAIKIDSTLAEAYLLRGSILSNEQGQKEEAKINLKKAYSLQPGDPEVLQTLGGFLIRDGQYEKASSLIVKSIERQYSQNEPAYFFRWGSIYQ